MKTNSLQNNFLWVNFIISKFPIKMHFEILNPLYNINAVLCCTVLLIFSSKSMNSWDTFKSILALFLFRANQKCIIRETFILFMTIFPSYVEKNHLKRWLVDQLPNLFRTVVEVIKTHKSKQWTHNFLVFFCSRTKTLLVPSILSWSVRWRPSETWSTLTWRSWPRLAEIW